jgi:hypothetical protein
VWHLPDGDLPYADLEITHVEHNSKQTPKVREDL